jgi:hypothetical protein
VVAGDQVNAVLLVPAGRLNDDFGKRPLARAITTPSEKPGATIFVGKQAK